MVCARTSALLGLLLLAGSLGAQQPQRATIQQVDADKNRITLNVGGKSMTFTVNDQTKMKDASGEELTQRLRSPGLKSGAPVLFLAEKAEDGSPLRGLKLAGAAGGKNPPPLVKVDSSKLRPLTELGTDKYEGFEGGLYPGGKNERPAGHEAAGLALAQQIRPLDIDGKVHPSGKIVLLSLGMSNTDQMSQGFRRHLQADSEHNPAVVFVNGAVGGMTASKIQNPDAAPGTAYWNTVDQRLKQSGVSRAQVQAVWIKEADARPSEGFPGYAKKLQAELTKIVQLLPERFPNVKQVFLSSRTYGGYATTPLNPEPYAYESGFSVRWLIEEQIKGDPALNYDPKKGAVRAPWLSWGPYVWANGATKRADGFSYDINDFVEDDRTHLSPSGIDKVGRAMLQFFKTDSTTRPWFIGPRLDRVCRYLPSVAGVPQLPAKSSAAIGSRSRRASSRLRRCSGRTDGSPA